MSTLYFMFILMVFKCLWKLHKHVKLSRDPTVGTAVDDDDERPTLLHGRRKARVQRKRSFYLQGQQTCRRQSHCSPHLVLRRIWKVKITLMILATFSSCLQNLSNRKDLLPVDRLTEKAISLVTKLAGAVDSPSRLVTVCILVTATVIFWAEVWSCGVQ